MGIAQLLKIIGPVKLILLALFVILPCIELLDGRFGLEDIFSVVVLFLLINDLIHDIRKVFVPKVNLNVQSDTSDFWDNIRSATFLKAGPLSDFFYLRKGGFRIREVLNQDATGRPLLSSSVESQLQFSHPPRPQIHSIAIKRDRSLKQRMNMVFAAMCSIPWIMDWFILGQDVQNKIFLLCMMAWSMAILGVSLREYRFKKLKLVYYNLAFWTFIVSALAWSS
ncbi:MAG: hypothetical protein A2X86_18135 [Bdellovibrionales bacterium GWA2_49_15]|nr:MAG: hypothetical protein A2X86_18135 [Bdellovibrionales bacterium GWA2_49_15]HAZ11644.1 hypothetical protein [Bdellovibrionales bacterium]